ncbi:MAG: hypothetical protein ACYS8W_20935, partial [Planctomycetota bacterium]
MKFSLNFTLALFVILLFTAVLAACLVWKPVVIGYYLLKYDSAKPGERVVLVDKIFKMKKGSVEALAGRLHGGRKAAEFLAENWAVFNDCLPAKPREEDPEKAEWAAGVFFSRSNIKNHKPLHLAAARGYEDMVRLL